MIISASRRTDIPAFYSDWFVKRLEEGYVLVRNPMNPNLVSKVNLGPNLVDCFVFWTKDPQAMMGKLERLQDYHYYFLFTITSYGKDLERNLAAKEKIIETFIGLSREIGRQRVIWRYDPILLTDRVDSRYHYQYFEYLANKLASHTGRCIISFLNMYSKCKRNLAGFKIRLPGNSEAIEIAGNLNSIARKYDMVMEACAEDIDFSGVGIKPGKCIDDSLINQITGKHLEIPKDKYQRTTCGCVESVDIGAYNTCAHHCLYCYANANQEIVNENRCRHRVASPLLVGDLTDQDKVVARGPGLCAPVRIDKRLEVKK